MSTPEFTAVPRPMVLPPRHRKNMIPSLYVDPEYEAEIRSHHPRTQLDLLLWAYLKIHADCPVDQIHLGLKIKGGWDTHHSPEDVDWAESRDIVCGFMDYLHEYWDIHVDLRDLETGSGDRLRTIGGFIRHVHKHMVPFLYLLADPVPEVPTKEQVAAVMPPWLQP